MGTEEGGNASQAAGGQRVARVVRVRKSMARDTAHRKCNSSCWVRALSNRKLP